MHNELSIPEQITDKLELEESSHSIPARKEFVEPKISVPVDVLEATTFFQSTDTGGSN